GGGGGVGVGGGLGGRRGGGAAAAAAVMALQRVDVDLVAAGARRDLVRLAVAGPVQDGLAGGAVLLGDFPGRLAVAVLLRLVGLRLGVRVVRRVVRGLDAGRARVRRGDRRGR